MRLTTTLDLDNYAFQSFTGLEVSRILQAYADAVKYLAGYDLAPVCPLVDRNGNTVGEARVER